jgi:hypothetical protein
MLSWRKLSSPPSAGTHHSSMLMQFCKAENTFTAKDSSTRHRLAFPWNMLCDYADANPKLLIPLIARNNMIQLNVKCRPKSGLDQAENRFRKKLSMIHSIRSREHKTAKLWRSGWAVCFQLRSTTWWPVPRPAEGLRCRRWNLHMHFNTPATHTHGVLQTPLSKLFPW